jgi:Fic family protein
MIRYEPPKQWLVYDLQAILKPLIEAKAAVLALTEIPSQRSWSEQLQMVQLKREVAGTSRIEGADFTERELDAAMRETPEQLHTRSQRQAAAAVATYRWIAQLPDDRPVVPELVCEIHRRLVTGADDDHCPPGKLRGRDENVNFGVPRHRGADGGPDCTRAFEELFVAVRTEFSAHDPLIRALAVHYHFAAMHPFLDGNGRTARALEALMLQRTGLRDTLFIAMSNYYYEEKNQYLATLAAVRAAEHNLTAFLEFGLRGIGLQCQRLLAEIRANVRKALFRNLMFDLFNRLRTPRKRVMAQRHLEILKLLLDVDALLLDEVTKRTAPFYHALSNPHKAIIRDLNYLIGLKALGFEKLPDQKYRIFVRLEWPTEITETEFFKQVTQLPKSKTHAFLS